MTARRIARGGIAAFALVFASLAGARAADAAQIVITQADDYTKIEAAKAGDEVVIAPGTYGFRVHLTAKATASHPIVIRAQDPAKPPVWDLSAGLVENAPGSYGAGDKGRGCWQVDGGTGYVIESIVFTGCRTVDRDSAGIRYLNGAEVTIRDAYFHDNDNGLTGGSQDSTAVVEWSEFAKNGDPAATAPTHNMYIYGGTFTLRWSYVHDSVQAENFHIRAHDAVLESNWFSRGKNYEGDLMTDDDFTGAGAGPFSQTMYVVGNVFVQAAAPDNTGQVLAVFNDTKVANLAFVVHVINNTFVGSGKNSAFVHLSNADGTTMQAEIANNILYGTMRAYLVENAAQATVVGASNWMPTGGDPGTLGDTVFSADPGFKSLAGKDFMLDVTSIVTNKATAIPKSLPVTEYYEDETLARRYRPRLAVHDLGAFESTTTGPGYGPYDPPPVPDAGPPPPPPPIDDGGNPLTGSSGSSGASGGAGDAGNGASPGGASSGCGCRVGDPGGRVADVAGLALLALATFTALARAISRGRARRP